MVDCIHGSNVGQQGLGCADVAGGLVPADVLLASLHGHAQCLLAVHVLAHTCTKDSIQAWYAGVQLLGLHGHVQCLLAVHVLAHTCTIDSILDSIQSSCFHICNAMRKACFQSMSLLTPATKSSANVTFMLRTLVHVLLVQPDTQLDASSFNTETADLAAPALPKALYDQIQSRFCYPSVCCSRLNQCILQQV